MEIRIWPVVVLAGSGILWAVLTEVVYQLARRGWEDGGSPSAIASLRRCRTNPSCNAQTDACPGSARTGAAGTDVATLTGHTGLPVGVVATAVRRLIAGDYVSAVDTSTQVGDDYIAIRLQERGLRETGVWPSEADMIAALVAAFSDAAEQVEDEDDRGCLQRAGAALGGLSRDVAVQVAAELASKGIMLGM